LAFVYSTYNNASLAYNPASVYGAQLLSIIFII